MIRCLITCFVSLSFATTTDTLLNTVRAFNAVPCQFYAALKRHPIQSLAEDIPHRKQLLCEYAAVSTGTFLSAMTSYTDTQSLCSDAYLPLFEDCGANFVVVNSYSNSDSAVVVLRTDVVRWYEKDYDCVSDIIPVLCADYGISRQNRVMIQNRLRSCNDSDTQYSGIEIRAQAYITYELLCVGGHWLVCGVSKQYRHGKMVLTWKRK